MTNNRLATAYSMLIGALNQNDTNALSYAQIINESKAEINYELFNSISDSLMVTAYGLNTDTYELFVKIIDVLECIVEKETYLLTAKTAVVDMNNTELVRDNINKILSTTLTYQCSSFEIDLLNKLVIHAIYIKDNDLLIKLTTKINQLGVQL